MSLIRDIGNQPSLFADFDGEVIHFASGASPMPTKKPRVIVTLDPDDYELLRRVAVASGGSMASVLREYVEMSRPMLRHLADLADSMERAERERKELHQGAVDRAIQKGQALFDLAEGQLPLFYDWLEVLAETVEGKPGLDPRLVTRGSGGDMEPVSGSEGREK